MSRSLCNCHWSRQMSNMRHWWNKIFFAIIRVMIALNQTILMAPFIYYKDSPKSLSSSHDFPIEKAVKWKFRTHSLVTGMAIFLGISYAAASPILIMISSELYTNTRKDQDNLFTILAKFTMTTDMLCSILIVASQIYYRENIVEILNLFNELVVKFEKFNKDLVEFKIFVLMWLKVGLFVHNLVLSLPFIITTYSRLSTQSIVGFLCTQYIQELSSIFSLNVFVFILLLLAFSLQLENQLKLSANVSNDLKMSQLMSLQDSLHRLISLVIETFQFGIFLIILVNFVTILCNIYALLDYYVTVHRVFGTFVTYIVSIALELYSLILVAYLCQRSQRKVKDLFLNREESYFLKFPTSLSMVESSVLWPQLNEFYILDLFLLDNTFALFLFAYSINFIVIILEFEVNKATNKRF